MKERTTCGRSDAKANGIKFGRKPILPRTISKRPASASKLARRARIMVKNLLGSRDPPRIVNFDADSGRSADLKV